MQNYLTYKIIAIMVFMSFFIPENTIYSKEDIKEKEYLKTRYSWLNDDLYYKYHYLSGEYNVPVMLACAVIQKESKGRVIVSEKNSNGTYDYGRFQINTVHRQSNPRSLLNDDLNAFYGFYYLSLCIKRSTRGLSDAIRMYNQGANSNRKKYQRWDYVEEIVTCYSQDIIKSKL